MRNIFYATVTGIYSISVFIKTACNNKIQVTPCKNSRNTCTRPSHVDFQHQIEEINKTLHELDLKFTNNNTMVNFLKQENKRLTDLVHTLQNSLSTPTLTTELPTISSRQISHTSTSIKKKYDNTLSLSKSPTASTRSSISCSSKSIRQPDNSIINHSFNKNSKIYDSNNSNNNSIRY